MPDPLTYFLLQVASNPKLPMELRQAADRTLKRIEDGQQQRPEGHHGDAQEQGEAEAKEGPQA